MEASRLLISLAVAVSGLSCAADLPFEVAGPGVWADFLFRALRTSVDSSIDPDELSAVEQMLRQWDPIGILGDPGLNWPPDEYDAYAPGVLRHLHAGASVEVMAEHLNQLATGHMGLSRPLEADRQFARYLVEWWRDTRGSNAA